MVKRSFLLPSTWELGNDQKEVISSYREKTPAVKELTEAEAVVSRMWIGGGGAGHKGRGVLAKKAQVLEANFEEQSRGSIKS